jgi:hypothetical protein
MAAEKFTGQDTRAMSSVTNKVSGGYLPTLDGWRTVAIL